MKLAMIGLGRMGGNMSRRLQQGGHTVIGYDPGAEARDALAADGVETVDSLEAAVEALPAPRVVWLMVPAGEVVDATLGQLLPLLDAGDVVVDGGNSFYRDTLRRQPLLEQAGLHLVDCGTSGGVWGLAEGYSLMVGGPDEAIERLRPALETLAPAADRGWGHVGPTGAGHYVKMVHNGIEYGMMQAFAEGFDLLQAREEFGLDLGQIAEIWRHGSVVRSWLLDLTAGALAENPSLEGFTDRVSDSGEGRWTVQEGVDLAVPTPVIAGALYARFASRDEGFGRRMLTAMRNAFGGHSAK